MDDKIIKDFEDNIAKVESVKEFINKIYYDPQFSSMFNRPVLSLLSAGCDYLISNLSGLLQKARG